MCWSYLYQLYQFFAYLERIFPFKGLFGWSQCNVLEVEFMEGMIEERTGQAHLRSLFEQHRHHFGGRARDHLFCCAF